MEPHASSNTVTLTHTFTVHSVARVLSYLKQQGINIRKIELFPVVQDTGGFQLSLVVDSTAPVNELSERLHQLIQT